MNEHANLIQRVRDGDIGAVEKLLQNHQRNLYRLAYSLLLDINLARQAVQEGLLAAIYSPGKHPANQTIEIWLGSLVVRACQKLFTRRNLTSETSDSPDLNIWKAYLQVNHEYQVPLVLHYYHGYSIEQTAQLMRVGQNTVRSRLGSGRSLLMLDLFPAEAAALPAEEPTSSGATIGHDQARFLLQSGADEHLSAQEWVPLQSHLDHCESCRIYRQKLQQLERDLQRTLRAHLNPPGDMAPIDPSKLLARQRVGMRTRSVLLSIGKVVGTIATLAIGIFLAYSMFIPENRPDVLATITADAAISARNTPTTAASPTPPIEVPYRTPVVFESNRDGNAEIYLLDPDGQLVNLTQNPAADTAPIWSPDGEWVAFLSDRTGKTEIFLMNVSGTRLVQITNEPSVSWMGPITWSSDGKRLAISGQWSGDGNRNWIYLIDISRSNEVIRMSFSRDAYQPRWAPQGNLLAYERWFDFGVQLFTRRVDTPEVISITDPVLYDNQIFRAPAASFDWSPLSEGLVHVTDGPYTQSNQTGQIHPLPATAYLLKTTTYTFTMGITGNTTTAYQSTENKVIASTSWSPQNILAFLETDQTYCSGTNRWRINLVPRPVTSLTASSNTTVPPAEPRVIPRLCAAASLSDSSWTPDGRWLVLSAVTDQAPKPALYALDVIKASADLSIDPYSPLPLVQLTSADGLDNAPQVRPQAAQLGINPDGVRETSLPNPLPPANLSIATGNIIFSAVENRNYEIFSIKPDGAGRTNLTRHLADDDLIAVQKQEPGKIAFFSERTNLSGAPKEVYMMEKDGSRPTQVTNVPSDPRPSIPLSYGKFSWSPGGSRLISKIFTSNGSFLAIFPDYPQAFEAESFYIPLGNDIYTSVVWGENDNQVYLAANDGEQKALIRIDLALATQAPGEGIEGYPLTWPERNWDKIIDIVYMPEVNQVAYLVTRQRIVPGDSGYGIFVSGPEGEDVRRVAIVSPFNQQNQTINANMSWLAGRRQLVVQISAPADQKYKGFFVLVDPSSGDINPLWQTEDHVYQQLISPDGQWLLYSIETGLWALNIDEVLATNAGPALVVGDWVSHFDWKP